MVKLSFSCKSGVESVDADVLFRAVRTGGGTPKGGLEEPVTGAWEGLKILEFSGTTR
jgi:hypothetical protein